MTPKRRGSTCSTESPQPPLKKCRNPKIKACAECKRHKIKCEVRPGQDACTKCQRSKVDCVPYDPSQKLLEEDAAWKSTATARISQLQAAAQSLLKYAGLPPLSTYNDAASIQGAKIESQTNLAEDDGLDRAHLLDMTRENSPERDTSENALVSAPMSNLYQLTKVRNLRSTRTQQNQVQPLEQDFISRGVISKNEAEVLFSHFTRHHHPLLWGGIHFPYQTLEAVRRVSSLLACAILTVAALHTPNRSSTLRKCYGTYLSLVHKVSLSRQSTIDDVRGLCLGSFYLPNICWRLSGLAVRIASEMNLHQSFHKLVHGQPGSTEKHHERARLWYTLYVCDRHFSIAYGRPPAMYDNAAIGGVEQYLESSHKTQGDVRLSAQVALFKTLTEAFVTLEGDPDQPLTEQDLVKLRSFNPKFDEWRLLWEPRSLDHPLCGSYPSKGVVLYFHFARFQLNSLALRGIQLPVDNSTTPISSYRLEAIQNSILAAISTLNVVLDEKDLRDGLKGVPLFAHSMVAFCATFLLKLAARMGSADSLLPGKNTLGGDLDREGVIRLTSRTAEMLEDVATKLNEKHLVRHIAAGIREMIDHINSTKTSSTIPEDRRGDAQVDDIPGGHTLPPHGIGGDGVDAGPALDFDNVVGLLEFGFDDYFLGQFPNYDDPERSYADQLLMF